MHLHIYKDTVTVFEAAKFWVEPTVRPIKNGGFSEKELEDLTKLILSYEKIIKEQLKLFYSGQEVKPINFNQ